MITWVIINFFKNVFLFIFPNFFFLDPQHLGKTPKELAINLKDDDWNELEKQKNSPIYEEAEKIKSMFSMKFLSAMIGGTKSTNQQTKTSCSLIVNKLTNHCLQVTQESRKFMENNPQKKLPKDYKLYPGKMDHSTVLAFKVGLEDTVSSTPPMGLPKSNPTSSVPNSAWQEFTTETGEKYFYNTETGESSWEGLIAPFFSFKILNIFKIFFY